ncbi:MAG: SGNH/GDSL hydrolase family protein [Capsulimonas sp.]|uniref:SGNH/GDSL hydrolase family protein n=1 Tax=Capsulimonas sp. TaxID=2494211 RepID=UPI0032674920
MNKKWMMAALAAVALAGFSGAASAAKKSEGDPQFAKDARIVFQGDSITEGGRWLNDDQNHILGQDYAYMIAGACGARHPEGNWTFLNRGISGEKVTDLAKRWTTDAIALKPDILSVLIGVNDTLSVVRSNGTDGVGAEEYERVYDQILQESLSANPNLKIVLGEPFIEPGSYTHDRPELWSAEIKKRQAAVERLAVKYHAPVVHYQKLFDDAIKNSKAPVAYWVWDGVHPTYSGHKLMADEWMRTVDAFYYHGRRK